MISAFMGLGIEQLCALINEYETHAINGITFRDGDPVGIEQRLADNKKVLAAMKKARDILKSHVEGVRYV